ncbi:MAG: SusC/RagA family TonB-linked outer membrane protein [Bacteroidales bacterium]
MNKKNRLCFSGQLMKRLSVVGLAVCTAAIFPDISSLRAERSAFQQANMKVNGTVTDNKGEPLVGVNVVVKGTTIGTMTDAEGLFSLDVPQNGILEFSYIGYKTQDVSVGRQRSIKVTLEEDAQQVSEIVVVGFGTQKKENLTGAVSTVDVKKTIGSKANIDVTKSLQGTTPGLAITSKSGKLGSASALSIRGAGTVIDGKVSGSPLVLVDGVPMDDLSMLNPADVESISVLKDAASSSIYGARGAFGVILIKTKTGRKTDKVNVSYNGNVAWNSPTTLVQFSDPTVELPALIAAKERAGEVAEAFGMVFKDMLPKIQDWKQKFPNGKKGSEMVYGEDWEIVNGRAYFYRIWDPHQEMLKNWAPQNSHNISMNGNMGENSSFLVSLGYSNQEGMFKMNNENMRRYNANVGFNTKLAPWLTADFRTLFSRQEYDYPYNYYDNSGFNTSNGYFGYYMRWGSYFPYGTYQGKYFRHAPGYLANANMSQLVTDNTRLSGSLNARIIEGLNLTAEYSLAFSNARRKNNGGVVSLWDFWSPMDANNIGASYSKLVAPGSTHDRMSKVNTIDQTQVLNAYATYEKSINDNNNLKVIAGTNIEWNRGERNYSEIRGLMDSNFPEFPLATGTQFVSASYEGCFPYNQEYAIAGYFMRINYDFMGKYLLELNGRMDGSSKFPRNDRWAFFPSASIGYRMSEESFMQGLKPALSDLKLRASYGSIGNQNVRNNAYLSVMGNSYANWIVNGIVSPSPKNPNLVPGSLTWERINTVDVGLDARFLNNILGLNVDWYQRVNDGMLSPGRPLPDVYGGSPSMQNTGTLRTRGLEIALDVNYTINKNVSVYANAVLSAAKSVITKYEDNPTKMLGGLYEGMVLGEIWGFETAGLLQESDFETQGDKLVLKQGIASQALLQKGKFVFGPGDVRYANLDGDDKISWGKGTVDDHGDLKKIGNSLPKFEYGFTLGGTCYGFDFNVFFQGVGDKDYWAASDLIMPLYNRTDAMYEHQLDYWTPENTNAFWPNPYAGNAVNVINSSIPGSNNFVAQTRYLSDLSYLRLKNLTVGYTLPECWTKKAYIQKARIFFSGENLAEFKNKRLPVDPEINDTEAQWGRTFPFYRTVSFGLQVNF